MSNILAFPDLRACVAISDGIIDQAQVRAYAERCMPHRPQRVLDLRLKLQLASKTAELLQHMIDSINHELHRTDFDGN